MARASEFKNQFFQLVILIVLVGITCNSVHANYPVKISKAGLEWSGIEEDGEILTALDEKGDGKIRKWRRTFDIGHTPLSVYKILDANNREREFAWAEGPVDKIVDRVWDKDGDGFHESFCLAPQPGCSDINATPVAATSCNPISLEIYYTQKKNELDMLRKTNNSSEPANRKFSLARKKAFEQKERARRLLTACLALRKYPEEAIFALE